MQKKEQLTFASSYNPMEWEATKRLLEWVDQVTGGRAEVLQRIVSYCFAGGIAAVVNMVVFSVALYSVHSTIDPHIHNIIASLLATEVSIVANFLLNDYITFRHLPGRQRSLLARCLRFHTTAISGSILTFILQYCFTFLLHLNPVVSQAIAIIIVLFYNYSIHHLFTYRHVKTAE